MKWAQVAYVAALLVGIARVDTARADAQAATAWSRLEHAAWVAQGARPPGHVLYMFTDPNCPFCHDLWMSLQAFYPRGLQVRYVMVGILASDSPGKAAAILEAADPARALDRNEKQWAKLPDNLGGGIPPLQQPKSSTLAALHLNEQLMQDLGVRGTPALAYRSADGNFHVAQGGFSLTKLQALINAAAAD